jgi:DNA-binding NarL/FixJ family response regulator
MEELETALTEVLAGRRFLSSRVPKTSHRMGLDAAHLSLSRLTPRQQEILRLLGQGQSSVAIAHHFGLTTSAITWHRAHIRKALGLANEWELARFAILVHLATGEEGVGPTP